ncbi:MAG: DUF1844 domain-containing protein [candidate division KSB1 bacterium]|nr:DUF1844 domain-containing protein [candidate division KSB1 bacterium]
MADKLTEKEQGKFLFSYLVMTYQTAALINLGHLKDPVTEKVTRDLEKARLSIDILGMLQAKTAGNLAADEAELLNNVLRDLRLLFVKESEKKNQAGTKS